MWKISQKKRSFAYRKWSEVLNMDFLNCMEEAERFWFPHLKWQLEYRGKVAFHSLLSYCPLILLFSQSLLTFLHVLDGESKKVTHIQINLILLGPLNRGLRFLSLQWCFNGRIHSLISVLIWRYFCLRTRLE